MTITLTNNRKIDVGIPPDRNRGSLREIRDGIDAYQTMKTGLIAPVPDVYRG
jgi:hypothetical protein